MSYSMHDGGHHGTGMVQTCYDGHHDTGTAMRTPWL